MIFFIHFAAAIWLSLSGHPVKRESSVQGFLQSEEILEVVLKGDPLVLQNLLLKKIAAEILGPSADSKAISEVKNDLLESGIQKLIPGISAFVLIANLKSIVNEKQRTVKAKSFIEGGIFRTLGVTPQTSPLLVHMALDTAQGNEKAWNLQQLTDEADVLKGKINRSIREILRAQQEL